MQRRSARQLDRYDGRQQAASQLVDSSTLHQGGELRRTPRALQVEQNHTAAVYGTASGLTSVIAINQGHPVPQHVPPPLSRDAGLLALVTAGRQQQAQTTGPGTLPPPPIPQPPVCTICCDADKDLLKACRSCAAEYCRACLMAMFDNASPRDPAKCCSIIQ